VYVEIHDHLGKPVRIKATRVVVYDDFGNPLSMTLSRGPNWAQSAHAGDDNFEALLEELGIRRTVVVTEFDAGRLVAPTIRR
jgi:hypothetical protein